ncbi:uncharacterized protein EI90DRAFT_3017039 [Cantharellus anzutake]|uniref:uncharacterized protein n=1 Tax=Cantharellus anzutake TaxID=1750568 RepID=UPI0019036405|nr:uncharacterized protein EI90DRAFT_3017039 [Cantharellus anzutake]KAF8329712.1 hypothetical protein EI90DRAFT_3017039 [Cantharellus anzutake]
MTVVLSLFFLVLCARRVLARTYCKDFYGHVYRCDNGLSTAARIAIGVSVTAAFILLLAGVLYYRHRHARRNVVFTQQPYLDPYNNPSPEFGRGEGWNTTGGTGVSYPPPAHPPPPGGHHQYPPPPGPPPNHQV